jgi:uncharacterized protein
VSSTRALSLRAMHERDAQRVLAINLESRPGVAPLDKPELLRLLALPHQHLVATRGDEVVGYLLAFPRDAPYDGEEFLLFREILTAAYLYVDQVAVESGLRGEGTGRSLYDELRSVAVRGRVEVLCCEVNLRPPNPRSQSFHQKLGFRPVRRLCTRDGREVQLLAKTLAAGVARPRG